MEEKTRYMKQHKQKKIYASACFRNIFKCLPLIMRIYIYITLCLCCKCTFLYLSPGLGRAYALALAERGAAVVGTSVPNWS